MSTSSANRDGAGIGQSERRTWRHSSGMREFRNRTAQPMQIEDGKQDYNSRGTLVRDIGRGTLRN
jgi:hypothetical protein